MIRKYAPLCLLVMLALPPPAHAETPTTGGVIASPLIRVHLAGQDTTVLEVFKVQYDCLAAHYQNYSLAAGISLIDLFGKPQIRAILAVQGLKVLHVGVAVDIWEHRESTLFPKYPDVSLWHRISLVAGPAFRAKLTQSGS